MPDSGDGSGTVYPYDVPQYRKIVPFAVLGGLASVLVGCIWLVHILLTIETGIPLMIRVAFDAIAALFWGLFIVGGSWSIYH